MDKVRYLDVLLFDYPLDVMMTDEEIAAYKITKKDSVYFYSLVPADMILPDPADVCYEILDEAFIQKDSNSRSAEQLPKELYNELLLRTMYVTGNVSQKRSSVTMWSPSARIYYQEDAPIYEGKTKITPLKGAKVLVRDYFKINSTLTNEYGETGNIGSDYINPVRYYICWEDPKWKMYDDTNYSDVIPMQMSGGIHEGKWIYTFENKQSHTSKDMCAAAAHRALYEYYYEKHLSIENLPKFLPAEGLNIYFTFRWVPTAAGFFINKKMDLFPVFENGNYYSKHQITEVVFHELGHASQDALNDYNHIWTEQGVHDGWAELIEYLYVESVYPGTYNDQNGYSGLSVSEREPTYTAIGSSLLYNGMTLSQIGTSLIGVSTWTEWKQSVRSTRLLSERKLNLIFEYPNTFLADIDNLIIEPEKIVINEPATFILTPGLAKYGYTAKITEWLFTTSGVTVLEATGYKAVFKFTSSGTKNIRAKIKFPDGSEEVQTKTVYVSDYPLQTLASAPFEYGKTYKVNYCVPEGATNICLTINQYLFMNYIEIPITHNQNDKSFSFQFPSGFPIDYAVILTYTHNGIEKTAHVILSDIR